MVRFLRASFSILAHFKQHSRKALGIRLTGANLPVQLNPFPSNRYPMLQLQAKLPTVLVQICSQPPFVVLHSLMSESKR